MFREFDLETKPFLSYNERVDDLKKVVVDLNLTDKSRFLSALFSVWKVTKKRIDGYHFQVFYDAILSGKNIDPSRFWERVRINENT